MNRLFLLTMPLLLAATNLPSRWALTEAGAITSGTALELAATTDGDQSLTASVMVQKADAALIAISVVQDGRPLGLPASAFIGLKGATRAWLEERGALSTLVIEGLDGEGKWRLALEFHPKQLWLRRLSRQGQAKDSFTYYDRDDLKPGDPQLRGHSNRGLWRR
jgi:hypothetical protein